MSRHLVIVPCELEEANEFISRHHRHHAPVRGWKWGCAVSLGEQIVGVAIVGRPNARGLNDGWTVEITRNCTDGTRNAPSRLYGACIKASFALGYRRVVTYTGKHEPGDSLRAVGFRVVAEVKGRSWDCPSRPRVDRTPLQDKLRWEVSA